MDGWARVRTNIMGSYIALDVEYDEDFFAVSIPKAYSRADADGVLSFSCYRTQRIPTPQGFTYEYDISIIDGNLMTVYNGTVTVCYDIANSKISYDEDYRIRDKYEMDYLYIEDIIHVLNVKALVESPEYDEEEEQAKDEKAMDDEDDFLKKWKHNYSKCTNDSCSTMVFRGHRYRGTCPEHSGN